MLNQAAIGAIDAVMPLYNTQERRAFLDYPSVPLTPETLAFFTSHDQEISYDGALENMLPYYIGTVAGYSYGKEFDSLPFKRVEATTEEILLKMMKAGRFKVGISDIHVLQHYAKSLTFRPKILGPAVAVEPLFIGFSKKKNFGSFIATFSDELASFKESESYQLILAHYGLANLNY